jgi:hypothetical protein
VLRSQIITVEVAWNFPFPNKSDKELERLLWELAEIAIPKTPHVDLLKKSGRKKRISDGTVKGKMTVYFNPMRLSKRDRRWILVNKPSWRLKIYLRKIQGVRNIRFEVKFSKDYLKKMGISTIIPDTITPDWLSRIKLHDFVSFGQFLWDKLTQDVHRRMRNAELHQEPNRHKRVHPYRVLLAAGKDLPACRQKHVAYSLVRITKKGRLQEKLRGGEFYRSINLFKE